LQGAAPLALPAARVPLGEGRAFARKAWWFGRFGATSQAARDLLSGEPDAAKFRSTAAKTP
jgi:hypothetical protein